MAAQDELLEKITGLTNAVKENGGLNGLRKDELIADFKTLLDEQAKMLADSTPVRMGEFQADPVQRAADSYQGKYRRELIDIANHGEHKIGNWRLRGSDMILAKIFLDRANEIKNSGQQFNGSESVHPVSEDLRGAVKTLTSTGSGTGDELVPTGMAGEMWDDFFAASRIAGDLPSQPMPTDPFDITLGFGTRTWRKGSQGIASSVADVATAKSTLTSTEQITEDNWTYNLDEDSVIAMMPALRANLAQSGGEQMDRFIVNADATATSTGNINLDDSTPDADSYYLSEGQDGMRHLALVDNTGQGSDASGAVSDTVMTTLLAKLGKYGLDYNSCRIVPDIKTYLAMLGMSNVVTFDKYGSAATIVSGELARYRGIPVIPSAVVPLTEADGKCSVTGASNVKGQILAYNRNFWRLGFRRGLTIEVDRLIQRRLLIMVTSFRIAIAAHGTRSTAKHTAVAYNIT